jgi:hypothetical protein
MQLPVTLAHRAFGSCQYFVCPYYISLDSSVDLTNQPAGALDLTNKIGYSAMTPLDKVCAPGHERGTENMNAGLGSLEVALLQHR